jgi:serine protease Do
MRNLLLALAATLAPSLSHASPAPIFNLPDLVEKTLPGVVNISSTTVTNTTVYGMDEFLRLWGVPQERKSTSLGSGFLIDKEGYIITNNHVVEHATEVDVTLLDKRQFRARIIGKDQKMDLALLQIRGDDRKVPEPLTPVPFADSDKVRIAESVFAVGNPFGLQHTVTLGIISAKNRTIGQGPFDNFLQTDASINPGNSGGPLFNLKGEVVGINTVIFSKVGQSGGVGFAIPANSARDIIADLKRYGRVPRPWLGIVSEPMTPQLARYYELSADSGILIYNVIERGPADRAGLQQGDIVVGINGVKATEPNDAERALSKLKPTDTASLAIVRGKKKLDVKLRLQELPRMENLPQGII